MIWAGVLATSIGCYLLKLAGVSVPARLLKSPTVLRVSTLLPVSMLAALTAVQTFGSGRSVVVDARGAGLAVAVVLLLLRAPFLVVVVAAAVTAALLRALV